eukprot:11059843-Lingulodinium_polyedra.AAC.1
MAAHAGSEVPPPSSGGEPRAAVRAALATEAPDSVDALRTDEGLEQSMPPAGPGCDASPILCARSGAAGRPMSAGAARTDGPSALRRRCAALCGLQDGDRLQGRCRLSRRGRLS